MEYLEREFRAILNKYGHYILLVHLEREQCHLECYDATTSSYDSTCPDCFGTGNHTTLTKVITRNEDSNITSSLSGISNLQGFGELAIPGRFYFMNKEVIIDEHDLIVDVDWQGEIPIYNKGSILEVSHIDMKRFEGGEPTFQKVYCLVEPVNRNYRADKIVNSYKQRYFK